MYTILDELNEMEEELNIFIDDFNSNISNSFNNEYNNVISNFKFKLFKYFNTHKLTINKYYRNDYDKLLELLNNIK